MELSKCIGLTCPDEDNMQTHAEDMSSEKNLFQNLRAQNKTESVQQVGLKQPSINAGAQFKSCMTASICPEGASLSETQHLY